jgi:O-antigen/teichoic acid export membrane protein
MVAALVSIPKKVIGQQMASGVVQFHTLEKQQASDFFWFNAILCLAGAMAVYLCGPAVAWFYKVPVLDAVTKVMALMVFFAGLASVHRSLLVRTLQFGWLSWIDLSANILSKIIAVSAAVAGLGYWALIAMPVAYEGLRTVFLWLACRFRPGMPGRQFFNTRLIRIGSVWSANSIVADVAGALDRILIGRFLGSQSLGLYSRAFNLSEMPGRFLAWPLNSIAVSSLARLQNDADRFQRYFFVLAEAYLFFFVPVLMLLFLSADHIVLLVLGDQWTEAVPVFKWLIPFFLVRNMMRPLDWYLNAAEHSAGHIKKIAFRTLVGNAGFIIAVAAGISWGIQGIAAAISVVSGFLFFIIVWVVFSNETISSGRYLKLMWKSVTAAMVSFGICVLIPLEGGGSAGAHLFAMGMKSVCGMGLYALTFLVLPGGFRTVMQGSTTLKGALNRKMNSA